MSDYKFEIGVKVSPKNMYGEPTPSAEFVISDRKVVTSNDLSVTQRETYSLHNVYYKQGAGWYREERLLA